MLPIENQLVCQELSMKMKELGFKQESLFYYLAEPSFIDNNGLQYENYLTKKSSVLCFNGNTVDGGHSVFSYGVGERTLLGSGGEFKDYACNYSAYTVAELGEMLPKEISAEHFTEDSGLLIILKGCGVWVVKYEDVIAHYDKTLSNAMAKMLIYLKENNLI